MDEVEGCDVDKVKTERDTLKRKSLIRTSMIYLLKLTISRIPMKPLRIKSSLVMMKKLN